MNDGVEKKLDYWAFKFCGKGEQEDAASDVMSEASKEIIKMRAEIERLRAEMQSAKADAWDDGYEAHRQMIEGIARKPSNPYR